MADTTVSRSWSSGDLCHHRLHRALCLPAAAVYSSRKDMSLIRLERHARELQQKLDALLKHQGIEMPTPQPSDMSPELQLMAKYPQQKIAAIKLYRGRENPGVGLAGTRKDGLKSFTSDRPMRRKRIVAGGFARPHGRGVFSNFRNEVDSYLIYTKNPGFRGDSWKS